MVVVGSGAFERRDGEAVMHLAAEINQKVKNSQLGVVQRSIGACSALEVGFVPGPTAPEGGLADLKVAYLLGADEEATLSQLDPAAFVIYQGHHGDAGAEKADLVLPGAAYTEKTATYVNTEGRVQATSRAVTPPGEAREDWSILVALSKLIAQKFGTELKLGGVGGLPYEDGAAVRRRLAEVSPSLGEASGASFERPSAELSQDALLSESWSAAVEGSAEGTFQPSPLRAATANFYQTCSVSRASPTMAKCVEAFGTRA